MTHSLTHTHTQHFGPQKALRDLQSEHNMTHSLTHINTHTDTRKHMGVKAEKKL